MPGAQARQVIYFVASGPEYRGCYKRTGRTRLITEGEDYATEGKRVLDVVYDKGTRRLSGAGRSGSSG